ncbi:CCHC-type domain-containing protein, partial [Trichonephila inaurata madagascariensis]
MEDSDTSLYESFLRLQFPKFSKGYKPSDFNEFIEEHIGLDKVLSLGRLAFPNEWQMQISDNDIREKLIKMRKTKIKNRSCWIFPLYSSEIRGLILWLPNTVPNTKIEHFLRYFGKVQFVKNETRGTVAGEIESGSRYFGLLLKPEYCKESLPHFLKLEGFTGFINIRGRLAACFFCKEIGHQKVECVKFREKLRYYSQRPETDSSAKRKKPRGLRYVASIPEENKESVRILDHLEPNGTTVQTPSNLSEEARMSSKGDTFEMETEACFDREVFEEFLEELKNILTDEVDRFHSCIQHSLLETASKVGIVESVHIKTQQESHSLPTGKPERKNQTLRNTMTIFFSTLKNKLEQLEVDNFLRTKIITLCEQFQVKYEELKVADKLGYPVPSLESVHKYDEMQKIMERAANFKNKNVEEITSIALAAGLNEADMTPIISQFENICEKLRERITEKQRKEMGSVVVPTQKSSTSQQKMMEIVDASEQQSVVKISNCEELGKEYQSRIIAQMKNIYAKLRKIIEKLSVEIDTNAETVMVSE